jgi:hypothetical protein
MTKNVSVRRRPKRRSPSPETLEIRSADIRGRIDPVPELVNAVDKRIAADIELLQRVFDGVSATPTPAALRKSLVKFGASLRKSAMLTASMPPWLAQKLFDTPSDDLIRTLHGVATNAETLASAIVPSKGKKPWNAVAYSAMLLATNTYREFARDANCRGAKARRVEIGAILFEIVTGIECQDLSGYVIHDDRMLDRIEPAILVKAPFAG